MSDKTGIQWTDATWNPVSGCSKVSPGCKNCYAEHDWNRLSKNPKSPYFGRAFTDVKVHPERLNQPLRWTKPRRIFVNSMSDLFHEDVSDKFICEVISVMALAPRHTFQILTKRPERMRELIIDVSKDWNAQWGGAAADEEFAVGEMRGDGAVPPWPLPNVHLGVSVENQETADERIPILLQTPAAVRFLSVEPLLEDIDLRLPIRNSVAPFAEYDPDIGWVIVGGESGADRRSCEVDWIRSVAEQCKGAGVPVFIKQDSALRPGQQGRIPDDLWALKEFPR